MAKHERSGRSRGAGAKQSANRQMERGAVVKDHGGRFSVALVYPNAYEVGSLNLGFQKVYAMLNARDDVVCERAFVDGKATGEIRTLETSRRLNEFDAVAFSVTFESDYLNVLSALESSKIPLRRRSAQDPLVFAGGICLTLNPEPLAPFLDFAVIGEAEEALNPLFDILTSQEVWELKTLASIPGVYVPSGYTPVYGDDGLIVRVEVADGFPLRVKRLWNIGSVTNPNVSVIDAPGAAFHGMRLIEIGKGCGKHCRFCAAGYAYRPTRHADTEAVIKAIDDGLKEGKRIGLVGSAVGDHPGIEEIFGHIVSHGGKFSVSSLRLDRLTSSMLENLAAGGLHTITVAPEAGAEALRLRINKELLDETILKAVGRIAHAGPFNIKLYFLVGLPGETMDDVLMIPELVTKIHNVMITGGRERGRIGAISVGADAFVPKPFTPFQWEPFEGVKAVEAKLRAVRKGLEGIPNLTVHLGSARQSRVHAVLSVGDRRVAEPLEMAMKNGGDWAAAFRQWGSDPDFYATRRKSAEEIMPWDIIDYGLREDYLLREHERFEKGKMMPECPPPGDECRRCGEFYGVCAPGVKEDER
ncbi:MAG: radical SAM protein [Nitrospinae bacterium]|nr:radical SAM protein [Nitrospinota bacterium]